MSAELFVIECGNCREAFAAREFADIVHNYVSHARDYHGITNVHLPRCYRFRTDEATR